MGKWIDSDWWLEIRTRRNRFIRFCRLYRFLIFRE